MGKESYNVNIYKLENLFCKDTIIDELDCKFEGRTDIEFADREVISDGNLDILYYSYTVKHVKDYDIDWHEKWKVFFGIVPPLKAISVTGHGVIFVQNRVKRYGYVLVFGRSFALIKDLIIKDYGISMADKLFDGKSAKAISGKYFSMVRNKSIVDYYEGSSLYIDDGEAVDLLKTNVVEDQSKIDLSYITKLLDYIQPKVTIHYSHINLTIEKEAINLLDVILVLDYLSKIEHGYNPRFMLPRMTVVGKGKSDYLDEVLLNNLKQRIEESEVQISIPIYFKDDSNMDLFLSNITKMKIYVGSNSIEGCSFEHSDICDFMSINEVEDIRKVKIQLFTDTLSGDRYPLMNWIDTQLEITDEHGKKQDFALYDGKWCTYNEAYMERIDEKVLDYESKFVKVNKAFSVFQSELDEYFELHQEQISMAFSGTKTSKPYREFIYNYILSTKDEWVLFDRKLYKSVEVCDLLVNNFSHIHVKFGKLSNLEEALRQSIRGERLYNRERNEINETVVSHDSRSMSDSINVSIIFLNDYRIRKPSQSSSLKLKQTFIDWVEEIGIIGKKRTLILAEFNDTKTSANPIWSRLAQCVI